MKTATLSGRSTDGSRYGDLRLAVLLGVLLCASLAITGRGPSSDLTAVYMAGLAYAAERPDLIYAVEAGRFTMMPPEGWADLARRAGVEAADYPFVYPPLWAVLSAKVAPHLDSDVLATLALLMNHVLLVATVWLAWRACGRPMTLLSYLTIGCGALLLTMPGHAALLQNQPQILVAALVVLAVERERAGAWLMGGAAMALAAALKGFPAAFALVWLAAGAWRPFSAFAVTGALLALSSVGLAGWPLHAEFVRLLSSISDTVLITDFNPGLHPLLAQFMPLSPDLLIERTAIVERDGQPFNFFAIPQGPLWGAVETGLLLTAILAFGRAMRLSDAQTRAAALWPAGLMTLTFLSPMPWAYCYIAGLAFVPVLATNRGRGSLIVALALLALTSPGPAALIASLGLVPAPFAAYAALAMCAITVLFWWAGRRRRIGFASRLLPSGTDAAHTSALGPSDGIPPSGPASRA